MTDGTGTATGEQKATELTPVEKRKQEAEADQAAALAERTRLENQKASAELEEWKKRGSERDAEAQAKQKELRLKNDELRLKNEELERTAIKDVVPDLKGVERGSTTVPDSTVFDALLGGRAVQHAAAEVVKALEVHVTKAREAAKDSGVPDTQQQPPTPVRFVVTTDLELAARDARYLSVVEQLDRLVSDVATTLRARPGAHGDVTRAVLESLGLPAAAVGLAKLLPGLLSLTSANRKLTTSTSKLDDDVAMMAVAGALAASGFATVVVEKTRLMTGTGAVGTAWGSLEKGIRDLDAGITDEEAAIESAPEGTDMERNAAWLEVAKPLLTACKATATALTTVPEGSVLSVLAQATLQEALHDPALGGVLVLKAGAASATQLVDDRPLFFADPISVVSTATIAYLLISTKDDSRVLVGGLAHGVAQFAGKLGSRLVGPGDSEARGQDREEAPEEDVLTQNPVRGSAP